MYKVLLVCHSDQKGPPFLFPKVHFWTNLLFYQRREGEFYEWTHSLEWKESWIASWRMKSKKTPILYSGSNFLTSPLRLPSDRTSSKRRSRTSHLFAQYLSRTWAVLLRILTKYALHTHLIITSLGGTGHFRWHNCFSHSFEIRPVLCLRWEIVFSFQTQPQVNFQEGKRHFTNLYQSREIMK